MGIQYVASSFKFLNGPDGALSLDEDFAFNWDFEGFGHMSCQLDGAPVINHREDQCKSPLQMKMNDKKNHTLEITMRVGGRC